MSILNRPYAGTWNANRRSVVQLTPDCLVYLNGDTSLPGCKTCHHNINIQDFVNTISVDFGVEPGASNCSIGLTIPRHYGDSIFRDGNTLLRPALEIHVYMRGFFPMKGLTTPNAQLVAGVDLSDIPQYPYYPVFHGVVTQVQHEYSSGFYTASMTCAGMLHFWEHQKISGASGGSFFGARPANSGVKTTLTGHPLTGKTPYGIIYSLYRDSAGVADGVGFALSSRTNYGAVNSTTNDPLYAMTLRYWEQRFRGKIYGLRMHGASGQLFTSSQQAYLSLHGTNSFGGTSGTGNVSSSTAHPTDDIFAQDPALLLGLRARGADGRILRQVDTRLLASDGGGRVGLDVSQLQAFPTDIGSYGQVNMWESTYESKMDVATAVTNISGYEFYQDADGDLVFKPPLFNLDTSSSRVYRIEPEDIVSISFTEAEPAATYVIVKGGAFQNMRGVVDESEWGCRSTYVDYKLVAQYGWIEASVESTYYTNARSAFYFAINHLDRTNAGSNGASVTIPLRPEIRPGYPVYIPHIDCFYYVTSVSHSFSFGSECTTTLTLTARRRKFLPPGDPSNINVALDQDLSQIDLSKTANPVRALQALDSSGVPRIVGFPNVVLAIDPLAINPLFSVIGYQAVEFELAGPRSQHPTAAQTAAVEARRGSFVQAFVQMMLTRTPAVLEPVDAAGNVQALPQTVDFLALNPGQQFKVLGLTGDNNSAVLVTLEFIGRCLAVYATNRSTLRRTRALLNNKKIALQNQINDEIAKAQRADPNGETPSNTAINELREKLALVNAQVEIFDRNFNASPSSQTDVIAQYDNLAAVVNGVDGLPPQGGTSPNTPPGRARGRNPRVGRVNQNIDDSSVQLVLLMSYLIGQFRTGGSNTGDVQRDPSGTINTSATLLEHLSDRKASLNLTVPGHYRYYSASHPTLSMQGYADIDRSVTDGASASVDSQAGTVTVDAAGNLVGDVRVVPNRLTHLTGEQAAGYIIQAWRETHNGQNPPTGIAEVLVAQWALETGGGTVMLNYNFGDIGAGRHGLRTVHSRVTRGNNLFQAYGTAAEGARHFVRLLAQGSHREALVQYLAVLRSPGGTASAAGDAYARQLARTGYYLSGRPSETQEQREAKILNYSRTINGLLTSRAPRWVRNANPTELGPQDPVANPQTPPVTSVVPESEITTSVVRPASDLEGISEDRRGEYVEIVGGHIPKKGLKVRVVESASPRVIPTNLIYAMTFEARGRRVSTRVPVVQFDPSQPRLSIAFINSCLTGTPQALGEFLDELVRTFVTRVGTPGMSATRVTPEDVQALIQAAVSGITDLRGPNGLIGTAVPAPGVAGNGASVDTSQQILNIANGLPNSYNPSSVTEIRRNDGKSLLVLRAKAAALIHEITLANQVQLDQAKNLLGQLGESQDTATQNALISGARGFLTVWLASITQLFRGMPLPATGPFRTSNVIRIQEGDSTEYSPVYPVSDALGFEHYGSYQYGRGLSIEPGGNYERLMATDPLQYATDAQRESFLRALQSPPSARGAAARAALSNIASDPAFANSAGGEAALGNLRENDQRNGDRTTMIATGLANYVMSDRDAVMKLPVNNVAYQMADLAPMGQQDTCACRGAEADLLLAAYMAGTEQFATITTQDDASNWVSAQMEAAAGAWSDAQSKMRGMSLDSGRRSLLDAVEGWAGLGTGARASVTNAGEVLADAGQRVRIPGRT